VEANMGRILCERATVLVAALLAAMVLVGSDAAVAQEKKKISWTAKAENTKYTFQHTLEIPDIPGHVLRVFELRTTWPDGGSPTVEGQKVVEAISRATSDNVAGNGLVRGYGIWRFESGDQVFQEFSDAVQAVVNPDQSKKTTFVGTIVMTGGTGKMKGIKGVARFSGGGEINPDGKVTRAEYSAEGEYWFEK
jgi:hypothetical protein